MSNWRRKLALRIDPTLTEPLSLARSTYAEVLNERQYKRLAEKHAETIRQAARMIERYAPDVHVACQIPVSIQDDHVVADGPAAESLPAHEYFRREADKQIGVLYA